MTPEPPSFEDAYSQLEACVARLEQGGLTLEAALAEFETGIRLANHCGVVLDQAELRMTHLLADPEQEDEPAF